MTMNDGGKGSSPRPFDVEYEKFLNNWDMIFGKKEHKKDLQPEKSVVEYKDEKRK